jgi:hypothetical protein
MDEPTLVSVDTNDSSPKVKLLAPVILLPAKGSIEDSRPIISGDVAYQNALIEVFFDTTDVRLGWGYGGADGRWTLTTFDRDMPHGLNALSAKQTLGADFSDRGFRRTFYVRPAPLPNVGISYPPPTGVRFAGKGIPNARVTVYLSAQQLISSATYVDARGDWSLEFPRVLPNIFRMNAEQAIQVDTPQWIPSQPTPDRELRLMPPRPGLNPVVETAQVPTFTGSRNVWGEVVGQIQIKLNGNTHPLLPLYAGNGATFSITASSKIAPGRYEVSALQWVNTHWSEATILNEQLRIVPLPTTFIEPPLGLPSGQSPRISGEGAWYPGKVKLSANGTELTIIDVQANGTWSFPANKLWNPGAYELKAQVLANNEVSLEQARSFSVKTPTAIVDPAGSSASPHHVTLSGTGWEGAWVEVFRFQNRTPLGRGQVINGTWHADLAEQPVGALDVYTVQTYANTHHSDESARFTITVAVPVPVITNPGATGPRTFTLRGTKGVPGGTVDLLFNGKPSPYKDIEVAASGTWEVNIDAGVGPLTLTGVQKFKGQPSSVSAAVAITLLPNMPSLETPAESEYLSTRPVFSGFGDSGDTVFVVKNNAATVILGAVVVAPDGTWSVRSALELPAGAPYAFSIEQRRDSYNSGWHKTRTFNVLATAPTFEVPAAFDRLGTQPQVSGRDVAGAKITVADAFDSQKTLGPVATADATGEWRVPLSSVLPSGQNRIQLRAARPVAGAADALSDWRLSEPFIVESV